MRARHRWAVALGAAAGLLAGCGGPAEAPEDAGALLDAVSQQLKGGERRLYWQEAELFGLPAPAGYGFGQTVDVSGNYVAVGAPGAAEGEVYVFEGGNGAWRAGARMVHPLGIPYVGFGSTISIDGRTLVVGAPREPGGGAAYVFVRQYGRWRPEARLAPPAGGYFGWAVAVRGETAIVGDPVVGGKGAAHVFVRTLGTWSLATTLTASDGGAGDFFGSAVALGDGLAVVGAQLHWGLNSAGVNVQARGAAYVFEGAGAEWEEEAELASADCQVKSYSGHSVAVSGDAVVVGNYQVHSAAHVFRRTAAGWAEEAELSVAGLTMMHGFGRNVAISGDLALVGAPLAPRDAVPRAGEAFLFRRTAGVWTAIPMYDADDPGTEAEMFGEAVAIDGATAVVSAPLDDENGVDAGAAYVFHVR